LLSDFSTFKTVITTLASSNSRSSRL